MKTINGFVSNQIFSTFDRDKYDHSKLIIELMERPAPWEELPNNRSFNYFTKKLIIGIIYVKLFELIKAIMATDTNGRFKYKEDSGVQEQELVFITQPQKLNYRYLVRSVILPALEVDDVKAEKDVVDKSILWGLTTVYAILQRNNFKVDVDSVSELFSDFEVLPGVIIPDLSITIQYLLQTDHLKLITKL